MKNDIYHDHLDLDVDIEAIQLYEVHTEIVWASMGFINNYLEGDHLIFCLDRNGSYYTKYDYFVNQFFDCPHSINRIDLSKQGCLPEQDKYENSWLSDEIRFDELFGFWDGTKERQHQHPKSGDIYYEYGSHLCNKNREIYKSKYKCWSSLFTFRYCNQSFCGLCLYPRELKCLNKSYLLYQKYVEPSI